MFETMLKTPHARGPLRRAGRRPYEFEARGLNIVYPDSLVEDPALAAVLEGLLEPLVDSRLPCAAALRLLRGQASPDSDRCGKEKKREKNAARVRRACCLVFCGHLPSSTALVIQSSCVVAARHPPYSCSG